MKKNWNEFKKEFVATVKAHKKLIACAAIFDLVTITTLLIAGLI